MEINEYKYIYVRYFKLTLVFVIYKNKQLLFKSIKYNIVWIKNSYPAQQLYNTFFNLLLKVFFVSHNCKYHQLAGMESILLFKLFILSATDGI